MKRILILLVSLFIAAQVSAAQSADAKKHLKLEVAAAKATHFVGEPLDLTFTLRNVSGEVVKGNFCMGLDNYNPEVWYRRKSDEKFLLYVGNFTAASDYFCPPEELAPQSARSHAGRLLYAVNPGSLVLREAGIYEFKARFKLNDGQGTTLESDTLRVEVQPAPESDRALLAQWSDPELLDFVQGNVGHVSKSRRDAGMHKALKFLEDHGGSIYAEAARKGLLDYLAPRAKAERLTPEERYIYQRLGAGQ